MCKLRRGRARKWERELGEGQNFDAKFKKGWKLSDFFSCCRRMARKKRLSEDQK